MSMLSRLFGASKKQRPQKIAPERNSPVADKRPTQMTAHGVTWTDEYAWLRDENWQEVLKDPSQLAPDIRNYLEAENGYADRALAPVAKLRDALFDEMRARIKEDDSSPPFPDGRFDYYVRYRDGGQYPVYCRRARISSNGATGEEEILFDGDKESEGRSYFGVGDVAHSPDHAKLAYAIDDMGSEYYAIRIRDIASGDDLGVLVENTSGRVVWAEDNKTIFFVEKNDRSRPEFVKRLSMSDAGAAAETVYHETDSGFFVDIAKTSSKKYLKITVSDHITSEVSLIPAGAPSQAPRLIAPRTPGLEYYLEHVSDRFFIRTNRDGAEDFKIMTAPEASPHPDHWTDWRAYQSGVFIRAFLAFKGHIVRLERVDGLPRIVVCDLNDDAEHDIAFDEDAFHLELKPGYEFDTRTMRFAFSSPRTPQRIFDYDMGARTREMIKEQIVPSGHNADDYVVRRIFAHASDGARVPITVLHHKNTAIDGTASTLLYGYGAYGITMPASFSTNRLSLVDRGFVYAIAHIRGGMERGYRWYREGKGENKLNTFTDFIAAADALTAENYSARDRIVAHGGSAGGMLMGAIANMAPEKFAGIVANVPFVDVLNTMLDSELPLTPPEWPEWGNPIEDREAFERIRSYSPYDNVAAKRYPHIFASAGVSDPRVTYWEPAKWVARLRTHADPASLILLHTNMDAGHGGASGRFDALKETARNYAFAIMITGAQASPR